MQDKNNEVSPKTTYLNEYCPSAFLIKNVHLTFQLNEAKTVVKSKLTIEKNCYSASKVVDLVLDGEELQLLSVRINNKELTPDQYKADAESLTLYAIQESSFTLEIETCINPKENTSLSGLYLSSGNFCTQCEAQGFREITYFLDRPDVMACYTTKIIANKSKYPVLLSNGNCIDKGEIDDLEHWIEYQDPFPKPSYLFALVAGDLSFIEDKFVTMSGRTIHLYIYVEHHNIDKCRYAMQSLINSMRWDEQVYGREYDLDTYIVVAVDDFNMGAMENKGLNVFNSKYVLAKPETATDSDYQNIEGVIGHEYFHNWSGNRVTCRDWFQLSLKEGFTVFRDQEFSADMTSRSVKRIEDVNLLRIHQFREDAGPMAHPVRPGSYLEINNFYTATVYNKGAEVVRMLHVLLGAEGFRKGTDLYFERHDGQAVTTEDFIKALEDANSGSNNIDFKQFAFWYSQAGTPELDVETEYNADKKTYTLKVKQSCSATPGQAFKSTFFIPLAVGLLDSNGDDIPLKMEEGELPVEGTRILNVTKNEENFTFLDIESEPVPSLLRGFSAPVKLNIELTDSRRSFLMSHDSDGFNRWESGQQLFTKTILNLINDYKLGKTFHVPDLIISAVRKNIKNFKIEKSLIAKSLILPAETYIAEFMDVIDPVAIHHACRYLRTVLAQTLEKSFYNVYKANEEEGEYKFDQQSVGKRNLKNVCLSYLMELNDNKITKKCVDQFNNSKNMTDTIAALISLANNECDERKVVISDFYEKWKEDALVIDKWFSIQATSRCSGALENVKKLTSHNDFSIKNPNKIRSLIGAFCHGNQLHFHDESGNAYSFLSDYVIEIDKINPQIASRLVGGFSFWRRYDEKRQELMKSELIRIKESEHLSKDVYEIVTKSLN